MEWGVKVVIGGGRACACDPILMNTHELNALVVSCYAAAGLVFGTVTAGEGIRILQTREPLERVIESPAKIPLPLIN